MGAPGGLSDELVFFVDRSLGHRAVAAALRDAGVRFEVHDAHFPQNATDEVWLGEVGRRGWPVLTADARIRYRAAEKKAVFDAGVALFILVARDLDGASIGAAIVRALPRMRRVLDATKRPFIARFTAAGAVAELETGPRRTR